MSILGKTQQSIPLSPSYPPLLFHMLLFNPGPIDPTTPHRPTTTNGFIKLATVGYLLNKRARDGSFNTIKTFNFIINTEYSLSILVSLIQTLSRLEKGLMRNHAFNLQIAGLYKIERIEESLCVLDDDENGGLKATTFHHIVNMLTKKKKMDDGSDERRGVSSDVITYNIFTIFTDRILLSKLTETNTVVKKIEEEGAYGNVGFSTGYSCKRRLKGEQWCTDSCAGFAGRWSNTGKFILIVVMFFGRFKNFSFKY
ncbi:hypothetical protein Gohar_006646, partial [Gossypium harknessii]|nr:hypothetical protein [Gossypium harknessii]